MTTTTTKAIAPKMRLLKFGSRTCPACTSMEKAKTLPRLKDAFPELTIVDLLITDENGDSPERGADGVEYRRNNELAEEYEIQSLPTLILEVEGVGEVARVDGAANLKQLKDLVETQLDYTERALMLPW